MLETVRLDNIGLLTFKISWPNAWWNEKFMSDGNAVYDKSDKYHIGIVNILSLKTIFSILQVR